MFRGLGRDDLIYRLLVLDLDGTVMGDDQRIRPAVREAVRSAQAAGVAVTLATGRAFESTLPFAHQLGITTPLICYQGGLIQNPVGGAVLYEATFPKALAHELIGWVAARERKPFRSLSQGLAPWEVSDGFSAQPGIEVTIYLDGVIYLDRVRHAPAFYERWFGLPIQRVTDLTAAVHADPVKSILIAHPAICDEILPELKETFAGKLQIVRSHPLFVEAIPPGVSKGRAMAWLAEHLGIPQEATIAVGDNENDLPMIEWAGLGVAMASAPPEVKAAADWIAPSVAEDGVAAVIERFIASGQKSHTLLRLDR